MFGLYEKDFPSLLNRSGVNSLSFTISSKWMFFKSCQINQLMTVMTVRIKRELASNILYVNIQFHKYSEIKEGFTYNGHFLLQVIHVPGSPLLLLGGSVIFVLCGGNAVTV